MQIIRDDEMLKTARLESCAERCTSEHNSKCPVEKMVQARTVQNAKGRSMKVLSVVAVLVTLSLTTSSVDSCSCFVSHPQDHYCSADYVAVINVKRQGKIQRNMASYFVKVKRVFKMTPEAQKALNIGTVYTGLDEASCGRKFELNTRYLITGRVIGEKVWVSLCNFVQEWSSLTAKQRKGFRRLYSQGCQCKVREQMSHRSLSYTLKHRFLSLVDGRLQSLPGYCHWETKWDQDLDCQGLYSICAPVHAKPSAESKWSKSDPFVIKKGQVHKKQLQSLSVAGHEGSGLPQCQWLPTHEFRTCMKKRKMSTENKVNQLEREWDQ